MKPIVGSAIVYMVQLVDDMICTKVRIKKISYICLVGLIVSLYYCTMYMCWGCWGST